MEKALALLQKQAESQALFITELEQENSLLKEMITQFRNRKFGASADRIDIARQPDLFNEAEAVIEQAGEVDEPTQVVVAAHKRGGRRKFPKSLPHVTIVHDIPEADKQCCECHQPMSVIGVDRTEKLKYIPATLEIEVHERPKYSCKTCECAPKQAKPVPQAIPKGIATASLLAHVLISKFIDATPLYRQQQQWKRLGIDLGRSLLSSWVVKCGALLLCLWELMQQELQQSDYIQADETPLQVLHEEGRTASQKSYMWLFQCGPPKKRIILYHYAPTRAASIPAEILGESFRGYLQTDGYSGYHAICSRENVSGLGCMAHTRRKFVDAAKVHKRHGLAHEAVAMIRQLYAVEKLAKVRAEKEGKFTFDDRKTLRLEKAKPVLDKFKQWLDQHKGDVLPKSAVGKAMTYARNEWSRLIVYLEDGRLEIDNNGGERSIKPFVIGRKNWLFCNTAAGALASGVIYSLLQSAKANGLPLMAWLTFVLEELPRCTNDDERRALLPHNFDIRRLDKNGLAV